MFTKMKVKNPNTYCVALAELRKATKELIMFEKADLDKSENSEIFILI